MKNDDLTTETKISMISTSMPKFIWICEITDMKLLERGKCFGTMVLDATEASVTRFKPVIYLHLNHEILKNDKGSLSSKPIEDVNKDLNKEYSIYSHNLKGF